MKKNRIWEDDVIRHVSFLANQRRNLDEFALEIRILDHTKVLQKDHEECDNLVTCLLFQYRGFMSNRGDTCVTQSMKDEVVPTNGQIELNDIFNDPFRQNTEQRACV